MTVDWLPGIFREEGVLLRLEVSAAGRTSCLRPLSSLNLFCSILELHSYAVKMTSGEGSDSVPYSGGFFSFFFYSTQVPLLWKFSFRYEMNAAFAPRTVI